jgi:hypothetical protein
MQEGPMSTSCRDDSLAEDIYRVGDDYEEGQGEDVRDEDIVEGSAVDKSPGYFQEDINGKSN